jgi:hypothetical protein
MFEVSHIGHPHILKLRESISHLLTKENKQYFFTKVTYNSHDKY